jgi:lipid-binding SYLF domain-containing protein
VMSLSQTYVKACLPCDPLPSLENIMKTRSVFLALFTVATFLAAGCATEPTTETGRANLDTSIANTMKKLNDQDPSLTDFLGKSYAYVIFPTVGSGGVVVGGSYGHGEVFMGGKMIGYADISQVTAGAQIGGESFTEIIAFENQDALQHFKDGKLSLETTASAVLLKSGSASTSTYNNGGFVVFTQPREGAMAAAVVGGQSFTYQPL